MKSLLLANFMQDFRRVTDDTSAEFIFGTQYRCTILYHTVLAN